MGFNKKFHCLNWRLLSFVFCMTLFSSSALAAQQAMVIVNKAVVYSDKYMSSPIGYISRGKKIVVGDIPRNKAQVYPIVISGKIAYIRAVDITTEKIDTKSNTLTSERFQKTTKANLPDKKLVFSYYGFSSKISQQFDNGEIKNNDSLLWHGLSLKGEILVKNSFDFSLIANYMFTEQETETYSVVELGLGLSQRLLNKKSFILRLNGEVLAVPFATYEIENQFKVKSYGLTTGFGLNFTYLWNESWGIEGYGGFYYTQLLEFSTPQPYSKVAPSFTGNRIGLGINYTY